jgi:ABC-type sugar transport system ATPase subunit
MASAGLRQVRKTFGSTRIVRGADFAVADGEFVVLVGLYEIRKLTLLRMTADLQEFTKGEIRIGKRVVNDIP